MNYYYFYLNLLLLICIPSRLLPAKLAIKIPTRSRPEQFFYALDLYYNNLSGQLPYQFIISCDEDDVSMNNAACREKLAAYQNLYVSFAPKSSKIEAYNRDLAMCDFDVLLVTSDDAIPVVKNYDLIIMQTMQKAFPDYDGVINFNDGYVKSQCNTLPIIGKKYFDRFGYVYHPSYRALACDVELTLVARALGREYLSNEVIIVHNHYGHIHAVPDSLYMENETWHDKDLVQLYARYARRFDLLESELEALCTKQWTILVCVSDPNRCTQKLQEQIDNLRINNDVEIIADTTQMAAGYRKNMLLSKCRGRYVSFIDDNVLDISPHYIQAIYHTIMQQCNQDVLVIFDNESYNDHRKFLKYINPIKRSILALSTFSDKARMADEWYGDLTRSNLIKTEINLVHEQLIDVRGLL